MYKLDIVNTDEPINSLQNQAVWDLVVALPYTIVSVEESTAFDNALMVWTDNDEAYAFINSDGGVSINVDGIEYLSIKEFNNAEDNRQQSNPQDYTIIA